MIFCSLLRNNYRGGRQKARHVPGAQEAVTKYVLCIRRAGSIKERNLRSARQLPCASHEEPYWRRCSICDTSPRERAEWHMRIMQPVRHSPGSIARAA